MGVCYYNLFDCLISPCLLDFQQSYQNWLVLQIFALGQGQVQMLRNAMLRYAKVTVTASSVAEDRNLLSRRIAAISVWEHFWICS